MHLISANQRMNSLVQNLRTLCSHGRSTSDICRKLSLNRQQFDRYLTGKAQPSLSTLRRICDFFGVDEAEILMDPRAFADLIRLRPPRLGVKPSQFDIQMALLVDRRDETDALLARHAGFYHVYACPDSTRRYILRTLCWIRQIDGAWISKTIERHSPHEFALPSTLRYSGAVLEAHGRIIVQERELGRGRGFWTTVLFASDHLPSFLPGLVLGISPEGSHEVSATRTVWHHLGNKIDVRAALRACGLVNPDAPELAEYIRSLAAADQGPNILELKF
jgi:transcriptional regulator with XRE-family HTH domain